LVNTTVSPDEPLVRSVFNLMDEAMSNDDTPHQLPGVGIIHNEEPWEDDIVLGAGVSKEGLERWTLVFLCDSVKRGGGLRGSRGAYNGSSLLMDGLNGWEILDGCPVEVERRRRYDARNENGDLIPIAGYVIEIKHPVAYAA